ncbi:MAG: hypothetical protein LLG00_13760 [Planctomycetaceae bacterium]|nr:hypothetical protein [Planctomycetaceae bacterium]
MPLSWNEIRHNAIAFARDWAGATSESAEKQTFWNEFFEVFGVRRRIVAAFEEPVRTISGTYGRIDLFWSGMLLVEHKSRGESLGKAESQAFRYVQDLVREGRHDEVPRYVIVSDFSRIALHDLEPEEQKKLPLFDHFRVQSIEFPLGELHKNIHQFAFIPGYKQHKFEDQDPINLRAVGYMDGLHDALEAGGYSGHELERFLVRVLFCLFAEDTGIFERDAFRLYIDERTKPDGSDLGPQLARLFEVLNTPPENRQKNLDETLAAFPYVNGDLFSERLGFADFNREMHLALVTCTRFDWSSISPAIFGSLFQGVMENRQRRQIGAHYTSERDILKLIRPLFLDDLRTEFERVKGNKNQLRNFHQKLASLRFLDPACGCGNFLVVAYRELRTLETEVLEALHSGQKQLDIRNMSLVDVDAFCGIEIGEWPARIAEVAMWLMDHQMNLRLSELFGQYFVRLPLRKSPKIVLGNALRLNWNDVLPADQCSYVLGNPPFVGKQFANAEQKTDMRLVWGDVKGAGVLDYVTAWYLKAAEYIRGSQIVVAFVSTNSVSQGEQAGILWGELFTRYRLKIHFAHRTFSWESEARGKAHVHVVIIGFAAFDTPRKTIFDYDEDGEKGTASSARNISPYLVEGDDIVILSRSEHICGAPEIVFGNMPNDGGHLLLTDDEKAELLGKEPDARRFIRPFLGSQEFINGERRWCLWLQDASADEVRKMPEIRSRVEAVREHRRNSKRQTTRELADTPTLFGEIRQPDSRYLLIPSVSSENRRYIPMAFMPKAVIGSNLVLFVPNATPYHFGVLSSKMHMAWVRHVGGRLKSDLRYSNRLVYNNFPWPQDPSEKHKAAVAAAARTVLDARKELLRTGCNLADLYDPLAMPPILVKAHAALDREVDRCYRREPFATDRHRVEFLFTLYEKLTTPLIAGKNKRR